MSTRCRQCDRFSGYLAESFLVCAIHPYGLDQTPCPDFAEVIEDWEPVGAFYEDDELIMDWVGCLTTSERIEILETHNTFINAMGALRDALENAKRIY